MSAPVTRGRDPRLAKVHLAKRDLGLDDDTYRDLLERITGRRSAAELDGEGLDAVLAEFRRLGWAPAAGRSKGWKPAARHGDQRKVYALWGELKRRGIWRENTRAALDRFCARLTGVDHVEWLRPDQSKVVIKAMEAMIASPPQARRG